MATYTINIPDATFSGSATNLLNYLSTASLTTPLFITGSLFGTASAINSSYSNTLFVSPSGNDSSGKRTRLDYPYQTITAAQSAAQAGDTIVVFPGIYTDYNLGKNSVSYYGFPGADIVLTGSVSTFGTRSIFTDSGASMIFNVKWDGYLYNWDQVSVTGSQKLYGFYITNPNSVVYYTSFGNRTGAIGNGQQFENNCLSVGTYGSIGNCGVGVAVYNGSFYGNFNSIIAGNGSTSSTGSDDGNGYGIGLYVSGGLVDVIGDISANQHGISVSIAGGVTNIKGKINSRCQYSYSGLYVKTGSVVVNGDIYGSDFASAVTANLGTTIINGNIYAYSASLIPEQPGSFIAFTNGININYNNGVAPIGNPTCSVTLNGNIYAALPGSGMGGVGITVGGSSYGTVSNTLVTHNGNIYCDITGCSGSASGNGNNNNGTYGIRITNPITLKHRGRIEIGGTPSGSLTGVYSGVGSPCIFGGYGEVVYLDGTTLSNTDITFPSTLTSQTASAGINIQGTQTGTYYLNNVSTNLKSGPQWNSYAIPLINQQITYNTSSYALSSPFSISSSSYSTGMNNNIYISVRTDGISGSGTPIDPYDGSTENKLKNIFSSASANTTFNFAPGTYSLQPVSTNGGGTITAGVALKNNWKLNGSGMGNTIFKVSYS